MMEGILEGIMVEKDFNPEFEFLWSLIEEAIEMLDFYGIIPSGWILFGQNYIKETTSLEEYLKAREGDNIWGWVYIGEIEILEVENNSEAGKYLYAEGEIHNQYFSYLLAKVERFGWRQYGWQLTTKVPERLKSLILEKVC